ncbi:MAG: hypothetical protein ACSLFO_08120 [Acidimicrobiales bacterium]
MHVVVCDEDPLTREVIEAVVARTGHEVTGTADTTAGAVQIVETERPDAVILDLSLGYDTDFDIIASAIAVGARLIVFSHSIDVNLLSRYAVTPSVVAKPDLGALRDLLDRMGTDDARGGVAEKDRRRRPTHTAVGPVPTGVIDAQAFFEAINGAQPGDGMLSLEVGAEAEAVASVATRLLRDTDRLLAFPNAVRLHLPGSGEAGIRSLLSRIVAGGAVLPGCRVTSIVVRVGEGGAHAFDRLKREGDAQVLPAAP